MVVTGDFATQLLTELLWTALLIAAPLLGLTLLTGLIISIFQVVTQVQEMSLVFVPKILAIFVTLILALPFMADALHSHMMRISSRIIGG